MHLHDLSTRHPQRNDIPALVAFANTIAQMDAGLNEVTTVRNLEMLWDTPHLDLARDMLLVVDGNDQIVGNLSALLMPPFTTVYQEINLHPIYRNRGLEEFLLERAEAHAQETLAMAPDDEPVQIVHGIYRSQRWLQHLLEAHQYQVVKAVDELMMTLDEAPPLPDLAAGLTVLPYDPATHREKLASTMLEINQGFDEHPNLLPLDVIDADNLLARDFVFVLFQGSVMVAVVLTAEDGEVLYVGVRAPWLNDLALENLLRVAARTIFQYRLPAMKMRVQDADGFPFVAALQAAGFARHSTSVIYARPLTRD